MSLIGTLILILNSRLQRLIVSSFSVKNYCEKENIFIYNLFWGIRTKVQILLPYQWKIGILSFINGTSRDKLTINWSDFISHFDIELLMIVLVLGADLSNFNSERCFLLAALGDVWLCCKHGEPKAIVASVIFYFSHKLC